MNQNCASCGKFQERLMYDSNYDSVSKKYIVVYECFDCYDIRYPKCKVENCWYLIENSECLLSFFNYLKNHNHLTPTNTTRIQGLIDENKYCSDHVFDRFLDYN